MIKTCFGCIQKHENEPIVSNDPSSRVSGNGLIRVGDVLLSFRGGVENCKICGMKG